ncbi:MAG TPA: glycosyltransferase family 39 protein, partial [Bacillota bacterium]|nr:glycosyltransferase family 39 protein [Bacillota bacterium]
MDLKKTRSQLILLFLIIYFFINLTFLTTFPVMHSDESWLSGLSRYIASTGDFAATEPFFNLKPRIPHAIRILFHLLQAAVIKLNGYSLLGMRLISLCFAIGGLFYFYKLNVSLYKQSSVVPLLAIFLLSLDQHFIYTAHFARQEILLLTLLLASTCYFIQWTRNHRFRHDVILALLTGLGIGIHPNSLTIAVTLALFYLYQIITQKIKVVNLAIYLTTVALVAVGFIGLSILFEPNFLRNYPTYGQAQFQVLNPLVSKWDAFRQFYLNLYQGQTGTYNLPDFRLSCWLFGITLLLSLLKYLFQKDTRQFFIYPLLAIFAINLTLLIIGRFNSTSIIFQFPFCYMLLAELCSYLPNTILRRITITGLCI